MRALKRRFLLVHPDLEPQLDQDDAAVDGEFLDLRTQLQEALVFGRRAEAHDVFDAGAVVPAAVEDHDLAAGRELLRYSAAGTAAIFSPIGRRGQGDDAKHARADLLGQGLDGAALAGGIAAFEQDDDPEFLRLHPFLEMAKLRPGACAAPSRSPSASSSTDPSSLTWHDSVSRWHREGNQSPQAMMMPMSPGTPPGKSMI